MAAAPVATGIRVARPSVFLGGQEDTGLAQALLRLSIRETVQGLYRSEARFGNWGPKNGSIDFLYFDRRKFDFGKAMQIKMNQDTLMDGRISAIEAEFPEGRPPEIVVLMEDRLGDLRMTRRTRTFSEVTDADVMRRVASDHGLQPSINVSGPSYKVLAQVNQSDLAFLRERARAIDAELWVDGSTLYVKPRTNRPRGTLKMTYGGDLREFSVIADLAGQRSSMTVSGWDIAGKSALKHEATETAVRSELNGDTGGATLLKSAFGERKESICHAVPLTIREAEAHAEAAFRALARRFVVGRGVAQPNSKLRVGASVGLEGLGPLFSGKYYLAEVHHVFDGAGGFRTEFVGERPGMGPAK